MEKEVRDDPDSDGRRLVRPELPQQPPVWERGSERDECNLVVRAQAGDQAAFAVLYERYFQRICRYVSCLVGNDERGDEVTREIFLAAWESLWTLPDPAQLANWLYRLATSSASDDQRCVKRRPWLLWAASVREASWLSDPRREQQEDAAGRLKQMLARVPWPSRPALILFTVEHLSPQQIAALLEIEEACVRRDICRGKEALRQIGSPFREEGLTDGSREAPEAEREGLFEETLDP